MALKTEHLKEAKAALKSMSSQREKKLTRADFVTGLIKDIHAKMTAGFSLAEICEELNKTLPEDDQFKINTFKTYVRRARTQAGIAPTRSWTRRTGPAETRIQTVPDKERTKGQQEDPASDFRDQGGDL